MIIAGIALKDGKIEIYGVLTQQTTDKLSIQLRMMPEEPGRLQPGLPIAVTLLEPGKLTLLRAEVVTAQGRTLDLAKCQIPQAVFCRQNIRYDCMLPVSLRDAEDSNAAANWQKVSAHNISMGGMYVIVAESTTIPDFLEAQIHLPKPSRAAGRDIDSSSGGTIHVSAHVKSRRPTSEGQIGIGIAFETMLPQQERALAAYIKEALHQRNLQAA